MSAVQAQFRRRWIRTTLALAAGSTLILAGWYTAPHGGEMPTLPSGPLAAPAYVRPLVRSTDRRLRAQAPGPSSFETAFERGLAAYNADDPDAAADAFEEAVRQAPDDPEAHINLGLVYLRLRRADDGLRELGEGARLAQRRHHGLTAAEARDATIGSRALP